MVKIGLKYLQAYLPQVKKYSKKIDFIHNKILKSMYITSENLGWYGLCKDYDKNIITSIKTTAKRLQELGDVLVLIGVGGSNLGAKATISALVDQYKSKQKIVYLGDTLSAKEISSTLEYLKTVNFSIILVSKSGTTLEPLLSFRCVYKILLEKFPQDFQKRIVIISSKNVGFLKNFSDFNHFTFFEIPENIQGRYSVFTPSCLLPMAFMNLNIDKFIEGGIDAYQDLSKTSNLIKNNAYKYAVIRNILYNNDLKVEAFIQFEPHLDVFTEWWKQLFAESEGKAEKGIFPAGLVFPRDLHSLGQFLQQGSKIFFETFLFFKNNIKTLNVPKFLENYDQLNYLENKSFNFIQDVVYRSVKKSHFNISENRIVIIEVNNNGLTEKEFGYLYHFFMVSCTAYCYLLDLNPFDQPGVEFYKQEVKNSFSPLKSKK
ncbi:hypothetical protein [Mycoplasma sp. SG1]|uniref:hypothetical protein n=1 Tax=Mycoplasma sp. SG1 TaxID=2810348 RepID=UPI002025B544|nr:hypothetical protein [Mycoplasma sp. SG1]URM52745.1 hypothetical protein JRW51_00085 [Mycoplasma sp. SG1]